MEPHDELDQQLWEFVYDVLPGHEVQRLREQITSDPEVARAYVRVKQRSELLADAAKHEGPPVVLRRPDDALIESQHSVAGTRESRRPSRILRAANWLVGMAAAALVCVMGYGLWQPARKSIAPSQVSPPLQVLAQVSVPQQVYPDTTNWFFVQTNSLQGEPQSTPVSYRFLDARGDVKLAGSDTTNAQGGLQFALPSSLARSVAGLEVAPATAGAEQTIRANLQPAEPQQVAFLSLDGADYRPGDTVRCRSVTLSQFELLSDHDTNVEFDVLDSDRQSVLPGGRQARTQRGVASSAFELPSNLAAGKYTLALRSPEREFSEVERRFVVSVPEPNPLPARDRESIVAEQLPPAAGEFGVEFFPEGGSLVPGLENRVYFSTHDAQRQPVEISGRIVTEEGREVAQVQTAHAGRGSFHFTPEVARTYALEINEPSDVVNRPSLPPVAADAKVLLRVESSIVPEGSPLDVQLHALRPVERLVVAAYCREVLVGQQLIDVARFTAASVGFTCPVSLPLAGEAAGVLHVAVFDYQPASPAVIAQRLVFCRPQRQLKLQVRTADRPESADTGRAEDPVRLEVFANDELDRPVAAVIGAVVVAADGVPLAAQDESSLPAYYYLAAELDRPEDAHDLRFCLSDDPGAEASLDLLLGTQGWRRFPPASGRSVTRRREGW